MTEEKKIRNRVIIGLSIYGLTAATLGGIITQAAPDKGPVEISALILLGCGIFGGTIFIFNKKWAGIAATAIISILLLNRWGILDAVTFILWLIVVGLISLIN